MNKKSVLPLKRTFSDSIPLLLAGKRLTRLEWNDPAIYLVMRDAKLMIFDTNDKMLHPLAVSEGDLLGTDWVVLE